MPQPSYSRIMPEEGADKGPAEEGDKAGLAAPSSPNEPFSTPCDDPEEAKKLYPELKKTKSVHSLNEPDPLPADVDR